jgi:hypothetical protein
MFSFTYAAREVPIDQYSIGWSSGSTKTSLCAGVENTFLALLVGSF